MNQAIKPVVSTAEQQTPRAYRSFLGDGDMVDAGHVSRACHPPSVRRMAGSIPSTWSAAQDSSEIARMDPKDVYSFTVDVSPPPPTVLIAGAITPTSAAVEWNAYTAPAGSRLVPGFIARGTTFSNRGWAVTHRQAWQPAARSYVFRRLVGRHRLFCRGRNRADTVGNVPAAVDAPDGGGWRSTVPPAVAFEVEAASTNFRAGDLDV